MQLEDTQIPKTIYSEAENCHLLGLTGSNLKETMKNRPKT